MAYSHAEPRRALAAWDAGMAVVREQRVGPVRRFAAVFPALRAGRYRICAGHGAGPVMVAGGAVTQADWPSTA